MKRVVTIGVLVACLMPLLPGPATGLPVDGIPDVRVQPVAAVPDYRWPLAGQPVVTRRFDPPAERWLAGHRGVDLAGEAEAEVYAAGPGQVAFAGAVAGRGVVSIDHPDGLRTTYQPVTALVVAGEPVEAGDPVALLDPGHDGCPVAACLHWGLRRGQSYLDPLTLLGLGRVRLLPRG
jgi:murein DD-endopeptidase MepM/ murein hydrolase activator NlpD